MSTEQNPASHAIEETDFQQTEDFNKWRVDDCCCEPSQGQSFGSLQG